MRAARLRHTSKLVLAGVAFVLLPPTAVGAQESTGGADVLQSGGGVLAQTDSQFAAVVPYAGGTALPVKIGIAGSRLDDAVATSSSGAADLGLLGDPAELELIRMLAQWPRTVVAAAAAHEPHRIAFYLYEVAAAFHGFWAKGKEQPSLRFVNTDAPTLTVARLVLVSAVRQVLLNGLTLLGVSAPEELS